MIAGPAEKPPALLLWTEEYIPSVLEERQVSAHRGFQRPDRQNAGRNEGHRRPATVARWYPSQDPPHSGDLTFMSDPNTPESQTNAEPEESFDDILSEFERSHS